MFSSAELIQALRRRLRDDSTPPGEFPPGWAAWFASMRERVGAITGATVEAVLAIFLAREPAPPPRASGELNRWQAFTTLWRQQWHPASEDDRGVRITASVITLLVHLFFAACLIYLAYVRFMALPTEAAREGEEVIQVEYIGTGTPEEQGGGSPQGEPNQEPAPSAAQAEPKPTPTQQAPQQASASPPPAATTPTPPTPETPVAAVQQPLQVTETPVPDQTFVLPPAPPVDVPQATIRTPELGMPSRDVQVVEVPAPIQPITPRDVPAPQIATPQLQQRPVDVSVREVPAPLTPVQVRDVPMRPTPTPQIAAPARSVTTRDVPTPPTRPAETQTGSASTSQPQPKPATGTTPSATTPRPPGGTSTASGGPKTPAPSAGSGPKSSPKPGALPSPKRGDDWGLADRNRPGGQAGQPGGLFNADGSPRIPGDGRVGGGLPPGTVTEDFEKIDRHGTWLKRPPFDYEPTSFDKFWVPSETLLQEWVRRSIKTVLIPIPGTSKSINCSVVLLALGGACSISDPNKQDVEAEARPPPDVPFKPELQEDQNSLKK
ncbi:hypothetical protein [Luteimonas panaciterrae]|uniref:hypothetical protein n=1 Tax=Luteimonas panaciterrae TaxID=363885 RepID=UPI001CFB65FE|nr:hypothetical protein [Luteimonas panaciterrae]